jgi:ATP-dependent Clp protease ATP-binding subunit ClpA
VDLGAVVVIGVVAGLAGGAVGAALVGTVEGILRQRQSHSDRAIRHFVGVHPAQPSVSIDHLDVDARKVVTLARQEAIQSGHSYIGSENLAMAIRLYSTPTLDHVWRKLAIDEDVLRRRIEAAVPPVLGIVPTEGDFTPRLGRIVRMAHAIASERRCEEVAPEHLLIALAVEGSGAGAKVLASLGATPERIREIVDEPKR